MEKSSHIIHTKMGTVSPSVAVPFLNQVTTPSEGDSTVISYYVFPRGDASLLTCSELRSDHICNPSY